MTLLAETPPSDEGVLGNLRTIAQIVGPTITALALIIGAIWAYFKFVRGRTFRPRLQIELSGKWLNLEDRSILQVRITATNIGSSMIRIQQQGTGLLIERMTEDQPISPATVEWVRIGRIVEIFKEHGWIEPSESVTDDALLNLGVSAATPLQMSARIVCKRTRKDNIVVFARRVLVPES